MAEKNVCILLRQPPIGTLYPCEGLRMSVALAGDMDPVTVAMNDGVFAFLKGADKTMYQVHIDFLKEIDCDIFVDKRSLDERQLTKDDLTDEVQIKEHAEILEIINGMDIVIPF